MPHHDHAVTVTREDGIALIRIDHPPVNALSQPVREGLLRALRSLAAEPSPGPW
ncbi:hypothetical protein [Roseomonas gilardii]|uniref:hypothetical protein n=1 Tax=Roseomonas gilardii TaxID=257708 RepID=UPI0031F59946